MTLLSPSPGPAIAGDYVQPGDAAYDAVRRAWDLAVDQRPAAVALAQTPGDVGAVVRHAARNELRVAMQGTGHGASALGPLEDAILVKTERMRGVRVDPVARTARVEAGVLWAEATAAAAEHGLAGLSGSAADVGVVGYSIGGGLSWLGRAYGLGASRIVAAEAITAEGRLVRADAHAHGDLLWALRGGGGAFAAVTALEIELVPVPRVHAGALFFDVGRAGEVLEAWREFTRAVPDAVTSVGRVLRFPPFPEVPEPLRGRAFALVEAVHAGDDRREADALLAPLRALGPQLDTFASIPVTELSRLHMDPPGPTAGDGDHQLIDDVPVEALTEAVLEGAAASLISVEVRHLGGALARPAADGGALAAIDAPFASFAIGVPGPQTQAGLAAVRSALAPADTGREYLNFTMRGGGTRSMFTRDAYAGLRAVKRAYDPDDRFLSNHPLD